MNVLYKLEVFLWILLVHKDMLNLIFVFDGGYVCTCDDLNNSILRACNVLHKVLKTLCLSLLIVYFCLI